MGAAEKIEMDDIEIRMIEVDGQVLKVALQFTQKGKSQL